MPEFPLLCQLSRSKSPLVGPYEMLISSERSNLCPLGMSTNVSYWGNEVQEKQDLMEKGNQENDKPFWWGWHLVNGSRETKGTSKGHWVWGHGALLIGPGRREMEEGDMMSELSVSSLYKGLVFLTHPLYSKCTPLPQTFTRPPVVNIQVSAQMSAF